MISSTNKSVSVVVPFYNRSHTIKRALESILLSGNKEFVIEVLIINDGSTQEETSRLEMVVETLNVSSELPFALYNQDRNVNAAFARNVGIEKSVGKYIAFLDSDDEWRENKLKKQIELITGNSIVFTQFQKFNRFNKSKSIFPREYNNSPIDSYLLLGNGHVQTSTILVGRDVANRIRFNSRLCKYQDWDFSIRAFYRGVYFVFVKKPLVNYYTDCSDRIGKIINVELVDDFIASIIGMAKNRKIISQFKIISNIKIESSKGNYFNSIIMLIKPKTIASLPVKCLFNMFVLTAKNVLKEFIKK